MTEAEVERIVVRFIGDNSSYVKAAQGAAKATQDVVKQQKDGKDAMVSFGAGIDNLGAKVSNMAGQFRAMAALGSPWEQVTRGVGLASEAERMETNLATMLGSSVKAKVLMKEMQQFAANTPMELPGISETANLLIQYQTPVEELIPLMQQLGDVALGDANKFSRIALAFGQMTAASKVTGEELGQMREAGFNPTQQMAEVMGISVSEFRDKLEKGQVPIRVFREALTKLTSEGGKFNGGMVNASKTISGLWSTMNDDIGATQRTLGTMIIEMFHLHDAIKSVSASAQSTTKWLTELHPALRAVMVLAALLVGGLGSLIVVWKVSTIVVGMVIGGVRSFFGSVVWAVKGTWDWVAAQTALIRTSIATNGAINTLTGSVKNHVVQSRAMAVAATAAHVALAAMLVYGVIKFAEALPPHQEKVRKWNDELARHNELLRQAEAAATGASAPTAGDRAGIQYYENIVANAAPGVEKTEALKSSIEEVTSLVETYAESAQDARKKLEGMQGSFIGVLNAMAPWKTQADTEIEAQQNTIQHFDRLTTQAQEAITRMREVQRLSADPASDPALQKMGADFIKNLEKQQYALNHTAAEAAVYDLVVARVPQNVINAARSMLEMNEALKKQKELHESIAHATRDADLAAQTFGMTAEQVTLYKFALEGATEAQLANLRGTLAMVDALEKQKEIMEEGKRLTEQYASPLETYMKEMERLTEMYNAGAIDQSTFNRALDATNKKFDEATTSAHQAAMAVEGLDAAIYGSAEAQARINAYKGMLRPSSLSPLSSGAPGTAGQRGEMRPTDTNRADRERDPGVAALLELVRIARAFSTRQGLTVGPARING